jgi:NAD(P)-dependent dehydrogenase (short-subunit alcohol dehydrogenase family)
LVDQLDLTGKVALVTGASRGIGRSVAEALAGKGARVAVHYNRSRNAAEDTLKSLTGGPHEIFCCDVSNPARAKTLVDDVVNRLGRVDVLVNNAGIYVPHSPVEDLEFEEWLDNWERTLGTNLLGPANLMYWTARQMISQGGGRIVNISSRGAFRGEPAAPAYGASKAGLNSLSQSMAQALAPHNICVTVLAPGWVETDMTKSYLSRPEGEAIRNQSPLNRVATPKEIARAVLFLASEGSDYLTGAIVDMNGASYLRS